MNENLSLSNDDSLADLGRRAAQNCFLFEKNLKKREEKLEKREENERRKKEERARKEQQARKRGEREASETRQTERRNDREEVSNPTSGGGETLEQMLMSGTSRLEKKKNKNRKERVKMDGKNKLGPERTISKQTKGKESERRNELEGH